MRRVRGMWSRMESGRSFPSPNKRWLHREMNRRPKKYVFYLLLYILVCTNLCAYSAGKSQTDSASLPGQHGRKQPIYSHMVRPVLFLGWGCLHQRSNPSVSWTAKMLPPSFENWEHSIRSTTWYRFAQAYIRRGIMDIWQSSVSKQLGER